jgi:glycogen(starch) synthase
MSRRDPALRVLMVSSLWPPEVLGGAELYASRLAARLRDAGHEVRAVTLGVDGPDVVTRVPPTPYRLDEFAGQPRARRARFHLLDLYRPATRRALLATLEDYRPDVVHSHSVQGLSSAALEVPSAAGVAHVHTLHDYWLLCQRASLVRRDGTACEPRCTVCREFSAVRARIIRRSPPDVVLAVSDAVRREHASIDWVRDRVRVLRNPVDVAPRAPRAPSRPPTFGYLGQLTTAKGVPTLLAAYAGADLPGTRLLVAGDGPLRAQVEAATGAVEYRGWVDDEGKEAFFDAVDCLVVPSEWKDPAPLVVTEARARGVPVIGADIGGIPELVGPGDRTLLFPSGDAGALARCLERFARAPSSFVDGSGTGLVSWADHLDGVLDAYHDAMAAHPHRALAGQR